MKYNIYLTFLVAFCLMSFTCGCSDLEERFEEYKGERQEVKDSKSTQNNQEKKDALIEMEHSTTNNVPEYIEKPMAWFEKTNTKLLETRKRLVNVSVQLSRLEGEYSAKARDSKSANSGYNELQNLLEKAREKAKIEGYPVVAAHYYIESEEQLNEILAQVTNSVKTAEKGSEKDKAIYNAIVKGKKKARENLVTFDSKYEEFKRAWDKAKIMKTGTIRMELSKEMDDIASIAKALVEEWNNPDTWAK